MKPPRSPERASESTRRWWSSPGLVYFLAVGEPVVAVKIGMLAQTRATNLSDALSRRLTGIQSGNHEHVQVLGAIPFTQGDYPTRDAEILERELHLRFEHHCRFELGTRGAEWFDADPEILEHVRKIARAPEELGLPRSISRPRLRVKP
jgi:hypothetical protein